MPLRRAPYTRATVSSRPSMLPSARPSQASTTFAGGERSTLVYHSPSFPTWTRLHVVGYGGLHNLASNASNSVICFDLHAIVLTYAVDT